MTRVEIYDCERKPQSVRAIKHIRELRGLGLKDAKDLIDEVYYERRFVTLDFDDEGDAFAFLETMQSFGFYSRIVQ